MTQRAAVLFWFAALLAPSAFPQAVAYSNVSSTTNASCAPGALCNIMAIPGTRVNVCGGVSTPYSSCLSMPATTYTSSGAVTPCPTTAPLWNLNAPNPSCVSTTDSQGNLFFWALPGLYTYWLTLPASITTAPGNQFGPYPIQIGGSAGCPLGATCDASYATLPLAFAAAGSGTLYVTRRWNGQVSATYSAPVTFLGNGLIQPASGQTITFSGAISAPNMQIFDTSLGGSGSIKFTGPTSKIPIQWFGGIGDCSTPNDAAYAAAVASITNLSGNTTGGEIYHPAGCYIVTTDIIGQPGVVLSGDDQNSAIISAAPGTAFVGTYLYQVQNGSDVTSNAGFHDIGFSCGSATSCSGVLMNKVQEGTICHDSTIQQFTDFGLNVMGAGAQNFGCRELVFYFRAGATSAQPIVWGTTAGATHMDRITVATTPHGATTIPRCIFTGGTVSLKMSTIHMEGCTKGIEIGTAGAVVSVDGVTGDSTTPTVVYIDTGAEGITVQNCAAAGSSACVIDHTIHDLLVFSLGYYFSLNGKYVTDDPTRGVISYFWDGTSQTAIFSPSSGQSAPIIGVENTALSGYTWLLDQNGAMFSSGVHPMVRSPTTTYAVAADDEVIVGDATSGAFTITLPSAVTQSRSRYTISKGDNSGNAITVSGAINGASSYTLAGGALHAVTVVSTGAFWLIQSFY